MIFFNTMTTPSIDNFLKSNLKTIIYPKTFELEKIMFLVLFFKEGTELDFSKTTESLLNRGKSADIILASPIQNLLETQEGKKAT